MSYGCCYVPVNAGKPLENPDMSQLPTFSAKMSFDEERPYLFTDNHEKYFKSIKESKSSISKLEKEQPFLFANQDHIVIYKNDTKKHHRKNIKSFE